MADIVHIFSFLVSLCANVIGILIVYQLYNKFRFKYLTSYLYYQIFVCIFLLFGFWEKGFVYILLGRQTVSSLSFEQIGYFLGFFAFPFFILLEYMWIKFCRELIDKKLSVTFTALYFLLQIALIMVFANILAKYPDIENNQFSNIFSSFVLVCFTIDVLCFAIGISQLFIFGKSLTNQIKRRAVKTFAYICISVQFVFSSYIILLALEDYNQLSATFSASAVPDQLTSIFYAFRYLTDLLPILYLRFYLNKYCRISVFDQLTDADINKIFADYKISKREGEIIRSICEGKSNKEIAGELFISLQTVKDHIYNIFQKTGIKNRVQLTNLVRNFQIVEE